VRLYSSCSESSRPFSFSAILSSGLSTHGTRTIMFPDAWNVIFLGALTPVLLFLDENQPDN
jgi:hypothetical protein